MRADFNWTAEFHILQSRSMEQFAVGPWLTTVSYWTHSKQKLKTNAYFGAVLNAVVAACFETHCCTTGRAAL